MPLKPGRSQKTFDANLHELRRGPQFAKTADKHGIQTARKQMLAIAFKEGRKRPVAPLRPRKR